MKIRGERRDEACKIAARDQLIQINSSEESASVIDFNWRATNVNSNRRMAPVLKLLTLPRLRRGALSALCGWSHWASSRVTFDSLASPPL